DYLAIGGFGSAFINVGVLTLLSVLLCYHHKVYLNGLIFASVLTVTGFSFFGKNLYNSLSIILGVYLYSRFVHKPFSQYIMVGLLVSGLLTVVSYITYNIYLPLGLVISFGVMTGILVGCLLTPLPSHTFIFHRAFTLYNIGFTYELIDMVVAGILRLFDFLIE